MKIKNLHTTRIDSNMPTINKSLQLLTVILSKLNISKIS